MASSRPTHSASLGVGSCNRRSNDDDAIRGRSVNEPSSSSSSSPSSFSSSEIDDEISSLTSSMLDPPDHLAHKLTAIQLPDLRFEQVYLTSLMPSFHFHQPEKSLKIQHTTHGNDSRKPFEVSLSDQDQGSKINSTDPSSHQTTHDYFYLGPNFHVDWKTAAYITIRDQLVYPLLQGYMWGSASLFISHLWNVRSIQRSQRLNRRSLKPVSPTTPKLKRIWSRLMTSIFGGDHHTSTA